MCVKYIYIFPKQVQFHLTADFIGYEVKKTWMGLNGKNSNYIYQNVPPIMVC